MGRLSVDAIPDRGAGVVRVIGIDMAAEPKNTGICLVDWTADVGLVTLAGVGADDEFLQALLRAGSFVAAGIDSPFGWPVAFVESVYAWDGGHEWDHEVSPVAARYPLRMRRTDLVAKDICGALPLSVSSDRLAVGAMRSAWLLSRLSTELGHPVDRACGTDRIWEVWPAGARRQWEISSSGSANEDREAQLAEIEAHVVLELRDGTRERIVGVSHVLDALVCCLVASAALADRTVPIPAAEAGLAQREGWLHLPCPGSLDGLAAAVSSLHQDDGPS